MSDGGPAAPAGDANALSPPDGTTKTVNRPTNYDIPQSASTIAAADDTAAAAVVAASGFYPASTTTTSTSATYPAASADHTDGGRGANKGLSRKMFTTGWTLPPGGGLRGGAPQPGETAISNGTSGWGPPPSGGRVNAGGWGAAPPATGGGAWGAAPAAPSMPEEPANNGQKLLNSGLIVSSAGPPTNPQGKPY